MKRNVAMDVFLGLDNSESLRHSEEFLGAEYDEGLQHWKYIKKYKNSKGKTVYVYASAKSHANLKENNKKAETIKGYPEWIMKGKVGSIGQLVEDRQKARKYNNEYNQYIKVRDDFYDKHDVVKHLKNKLKKGISFIEMCLKNK